MNEALFAELMAAAGEALEHSQGKRELRTTVLSAPPEPMVPQEIRRLRIKIRVSQPIFAHLLNVSEKTVQAWEAGRREPDAAALKLLRLGERYPAVIFAEAFAKETSPFMEKRVPKKKIKAPKLSERDSKTGPYREKRASASRKDKYSTHV